MHTHRLLGATLATALASAAACNGGTPSSPTLAPAVVPGVAFEANAPSVYVAKVKNILVGLPPTDAEVKAVVADPTQLKTLIDQWMTLPQYQQKMQVFFQLAFQQTQVSITDFADQAYPRQADVNGSTAPLLVQNATESFARTMNALVASGQPLTEATTTQTFMMTPALMELYAFFDAWQVDDNGVVNDTLKIANPKGTITAEAAAGPIALADSLNPASPNYMHWYDPDVATQAASFVTGCATDPMVYPMSGITLHFLLYGSLDGRVNPSGATNTRCQQFGGTAAAPQIKGDDFTAWKMVTIRPPVQGEATTAFYDLATLRTTNELVLSTPRIGFFTTPAFFANWQTNTSNEMRVTTNQSLIVATGAAIDGTDTTVPATTPGLDAQHAAPDSPCFQCHQLLDPTRSILASTFSWNYHAQTDPTFATQKGLFAFEGVVKPVASVADFGATLSEHPLFASAWVQKLCYYADSAACETSDPEFQRVVGVFKSSGYSWSALVRELLSSPLTTYASSTTSAIDDGEIIAVARRDHLCAALNARLGFADVCGLDAITKATQQTTIPEIVSGLPSDGYGRGAVAPVLPNQPTLFYRAGTENICEAVAALVIDAPAATQVAGGAQWSSAQPTAAIGDFVQTLMALPPSDPRAAQAQALLQGHFDAAAKSGASASDSLKSTFVAACLAPSSISIGL
jgi:hypothetical protein